jgi:excisionase family DNA binding protein
MATITLDDTRFTDAERQEAAEASRRLARGESLDTLTPPLAQLLSTILSRIADSETPRKKSKVSTTEAAEYLNVSRPYLYRLLNEGKLAYHTVGTHKRLYLKDVQAYKEHQDEVSYEAMRELQEQAQELNMGY